MLRSVGLAVGLLAVAPVAGAAVGTSAGWTLEQDVEMPSYAVIDPSSTNLNVDSVVLACEAVGFDGDAARVLQLQLYLTDDGPLLPKAARPEQLKRDPRAEIAIDGRVFPASIVFADDFALLADEEQGRFPALSTRLLDAMSGGRTMVLRLDLVAEQPDQAADFDGEAVIDLQAGNGGAAIAAVRRCALPTDRVAGIAHATH